MKKSFVLTLVTLLCVVMLVGCQREENVNVDTAATDTSMMTETSATTETSMTSETSMTDTTGTTVTTSTTTTTTTNP